jgi:hypothetical protein
MLEQIGKKFHLSKFGVTRATAHHAGANALFWDWTKYSNAEPGKGCRGGTK